MNVIPGALRTVVLTSALASLLVATAGPAAAVRPSNDDFIGARLFSGTLPLVVNSGNFEATSEPGEPAHAGQPGGRSVWYRWTPDTSGTIALDTCTSDFAMDTLLGVYTGAAVDALTEVASNDDGCPFAGFGGSRVVIEATAGTEYFVAVDGYQGEENGFTLRISDGTRPANDDFSDAQTLAGPLPLTVTTSTVNATKEPGEPAHAGNAGGASVWYRWTPDASATVTVDTCALGFDTLLAVYTGAAVSGLTRVASADDGCGTSLRSNLAFDAEAGTAYFIAVDGYAPSRPGQGEFTLTIADAAGPVNDAFADAQGLSGPLPLSVAGTNVAATEEPAEPDHAGNPGGASVWYRWTAPASLVVEIDTCGAFSFDTILAVYTGTSVDALVPLAANDDACSVGSRVELPVSDGTTYLIAVDGYGGAQGSFTLSVTDAASRPANDDFADATPLAGALPIEVTGNNELATSEVGEPPYGWVGSPRRSVWYEWTPDSSGPVTIETCDGTSFESVVAVYTGTELGTLELVEADLHECSVWSKLTLDAVVGTTYFIVVDGWDFSESSGDFTLRIRAGAPVNDNLASAVELSGPLPLSSPGTTTDATRELLEPDLDGSLSTESRASIWYAWTATASARVTIDTCSGGSESTLAVFAGTTYDTMTVVAHAGPTCGRQSHVTFDAVEGTPYRIAVNGRGLGGETVLTIRAASPPPANDAFADAVALPGRLPVEAYGTNIDATKEPGEDDHAAETGGASIWYRWTPSRSGEVVVETCGSQIDFTALAVYTGAAVDALTEVASDGGSTCFGHSRVQFDAEAGTTYHLALDGPNGAQGAIRLEIRFAERPANDEFADAVVLGGSLPIDARGTNVDATAEPGEPPDYLLFGGIGSSVWYRWTPDVTSDVVVETCGSEHWTLLGIWTGSAVNALTRLPSETVGGCDDDPSIRFTATAGTTYHIAVDVPVGALDDEHANDAGPFRLTIRQPQPPANDAYAAATELGGRLPVTVEGSTVDASTEPVEPHLGGGPSVWYRWTAPASGPVVVEACGSEAATGTGVFTGDTVDVATEVVYDARSACGLQSRLQFAAVAGTTYRIGVAGANGDQDTVQLVLRSASVPVNDAFAAATSLSGRLPLRTLADNADATVEPGEPNQLHEDGSLWWTWTPTRTEEVVVETCGSTGNTAVAVYTGSSLDTLTPVAADAARCGAHASTRFVADAGTAYRIAVRGEFADQGPLRLVVRRPEPPANDDLADATVLHAPGTIAESNRDATVEPREPRHGGVGVGSSIWYRWTPRTATFAAIDTCGSGINTALAVYTGSAVDGLLRLASSGDQACGGQSLVTFPAEAATTYWIAVDGVAGLFGQLGAEGPIRLTFTCGDGHCS